MTFEGDPKAIPVKGIMRAGADSVIEDGAMNEVIGLEYKEGSYVPYTGDTNANLVIPEDVERVYVHKTSVQTNVIIKFEDHLSWMSLENFEDGNGRDESRWDDIYVGIVKDVEFIGNLLCISTDKGNAFYSFNGSSKAYDVYQLHDLCGQLPTLNFKVSMYDESSAMKGSYNEGNLLIVRGTSVSNGGGEVFTVNGQLATVRRAVDFYGTGEATEVATLANKAHYMLREHGRITGYVLALYAYRLVTGEYIYASSPVLLGMPKVAASDKYELYLPEGEVLDGSSDNTTWKKFRSEINHYGTGYSWAENDCTFASGNVLATNSWGEAGSGIENSLEQISLDVPDAFGWFHQSYGSGASTFDSDSSCFMVASFGNILSYKINADIPESLKPIIDSCCIFLSDIISPYDFKKENVVAKKRLNAGSNSYYTCGYKFTKKTNTEIANEIAKLKNFYKVYDIPFNKIKAEENFINVDLKGKLGDNLFVQESLPISAFDHTENVSAELDAYNFRAHIYGYNQRYYNGYPYRVFAYSGGYGQFPISTANRINSPKICVKIKSIDGYTEVWEGDDNTHLGQISPLVTYPNKDAYEMIIYFKNEAGEDKKKVITLSPSANGGYAYGLDVDMFTDLIADGEEADSPQIKFVNNIVARKNNLRVSGTYAPNYFALQNTYTIGKGSIIGLASLSITLSQDTFGQYPLLVFCTDGIYSMGVDATGAGVYSNIAPFSREVCVNPNSICEIDGAVLFASSKGLMMATAQGVDAFLPMMNGVPKHRPQTDKNAYGLGLVTYHDCISNEQITRLWSCIDDMDFRNYIADQSTYITYASEKNKIVVYNGNEPYIYWIDIPTRNVTKLPVSIKLDNNDYPTELYVKSNNTMMEFKQLSANVDTPTMFQTRPIKLEGGFKSGLRVVVRGYFKSDIEDKWAALVVLGSYDGVNWQPIGIQQKPVNKGFHDIGCNTDRVSHKYMMIIFSASLNRDSHIDGIELTKYNKYNNKLK